MEQMNRAKEWSKGMEHKHGGKVVFPAMDHCSGRQP